MLIVLGADPVSKIVNPDRLMDVNDLKTELVTALIVSQLCLMEYRGDAVDSSSSDLNTCINNESLYFSCFLLLTLSLPDNEDAGVGDLLPGEVHEALAGPLAVYLGQSPGPDRVWEGGEAAVRVARHQPDLRHAPLPPGPHQPRLRRGEVTDLKQGLRITAR